MLKRVATYHELLDDRGRRFVVRLCDGMQAGVVTTALAEERIAWDAAWGRYQPLCIATAERLVAEFERRQGRLQGVERVNEKLFAASRQPAASKHHHHSDDRQLPAGDRA